MSRGRFRCSSQVRVGRPDSDNIVEYEARKGTFFLVLVPMAHVVSCELVCGTQLADVPDTNICKQNKYV